MKKSKQFNIRLTEDDFNFCKDMASDVGWSVSRYVRYLIESEMSLIEFSKECNNANIETNINNFV